MAAKKAQRTAKVYRYSFLTCFPDAIGQGKSCLLLTAYCFLLTAFCLLPASHYSMYLISLFGCSFGGTKNQSAWIPVFTMP
jgi:hypothetical protein